MKRRLPVTNLSSENILSTIRLNAPVVIKAKVKRCEQTLLFIPMHYWGYTSLEDWGYTSLEDWGYTSLEVKGRWGLLPFPCLLITMVQQPGTSSPPSRLKHSSEGVIWMCRASFTNSSCPLPCSSTGFLPVDRIVILPCMLHYSWLLHHHPLTGITVFLQSCLQSPSGLPNVDLAAAAGDTLYHIGLLTKR